MFVRREMFADANCDVIVGFTNKQAVQPTYENL